MIKKVTREFSGKALLKAPLIPSGVFTAISVVFSGLLATIFPSFAGFTSIVILAPVAFVTWYLVGLVVTLVLGGLLVPVLPDEIPLISSLNQSRFGRIILAFVFLGVIASGSLGISGWILIFALMCLGEYTSRLPHKKVKPAKKQGMFV